MDEDYGLHSAPRNRCKLYISNIDHKVSKKTLCEMLIQTSPILSLYYPYDPVLKQHCSYCIVEYPTEKDADYAYKVLNHVKMYKKPLKFYRMRRCDEIKLYVQNLGDRVDEKVLYDLFRKYGQCDVRMCWESSGKGRSYAFVTFYSYEEADDAIENANGIEVLGKKLIIDYALKKDGLGEKYGTEDDRIRASGRSK